MKGHVTATKNLSNTIVEVRKIFFPMNPQENPQDSLLSDNMDAWLSEIRGLKNFQFVETGKKKIEEANTQTSGDINQCNSDALSSLLNQVDVVLSDPSRIGIQVPSFRANSRYNERRLAVEEEARIAAATSTIPIASVNEFKEHGLDAITHPAILEKLYCGEDDAGWYNLNSPQLRCDLAKIFTPNEDDSENQLSYPLSLVSLDSIRTLLKLCGPQICTVFEHLVKVTSFKERKIQMEGYNPRHYESEVHYFQTLLEAWPIPLPFTRYLYLSQMTITVIKFIPRTIWL